MLLTLVIVVLAAQPGNMRLCPPCTSGTKGKDVVWQAVMFVTESEIFPDDHNFLSNIASAESLNGNHKDTYREGYHGGIWQVDKIAFEKTICELCFKRYWDKIKTIFGIDWPKVKWEDLRKPLYSALAARLHLATISGCIPSDLRSQAEYWKKYYNTTAARKGTVEEFIDRVHSAQESNNVCRIPLCRTTTTPKVEPVEEPKEKGASVVRKVVDEINGLGIFPNDHKFLCRVAWVESKYGEDPNTYRSCYYGGIWQVDECSYYETVIQSGLKMYRDQIKASKPDIDWTSTTWKDLMRKPLYSGLAARLHLVKYSEPIPTDLTAQAVYWKKYYNSGGKGTVQKFIDDVKKATGCAA